MRVEKYNFFLNKYLHLFVCIVVKADLSRIRTNFVKTGEFLVNCDFLNAMWFQSGENEDLMSTCVSDSSLYEYHKEMNAFSPHLSGIRRISLTIRLH